ncbi:MAG TPA: hypothetical protein VKW78_01320 [Terriglobales bacterium]|nr:hypothetical protein [Terriglobales bacterium]
MAKHENLLDREAIYEKRALTLRTIAGLFFIEAFIICEWIWMGLKAGSAFWLIATGVLVALSLICFGAAESQHRKAAEAVKLWAETVHVRPVESEPHKAA